MSIENKLITIANNIPKVCKLLASTKSISDTMLNINDVGKNGNNLKIQLSSNTLTDFSEITIHRTGKNLLPYPYYDTTRTHNGITYTDNGDGTITANGTATDISIFRLCEVNPYPYDYSVGNICISGCPKGGSAETYYINCIPTGHKDVGNSIGFSTNFKWFRFNIYVTKGTTLNNVVFKPQVEFGKTPTEFEKGTMQTAIANSDGTVAGLTSVSPNMMLFSSTNNVTITCDYPSSLDPSSNEKFIELQDAFARTKAIITVSVCRNAF